MSETARPFPESLCHRCRHVQLVRSARGSTFVLCRALAEKYPRQPVARCPSFAVRDLEDGPAREVTG